MFPLNLTTIKYGILAVALISIGSYVWFLKHEVTTLDTELSQTKANLVIANADITRLNGAITEQNSAIDALKTDADKRLLINQQALAQAQTQANKYKTRADALLHAQPTGTSSCDSASKLITEYIHATH